MKKKKFLLDFSPFNVKFCLCTCVGKECFISWKPRRLSPLSQHIQLGKFEGGTRELPFSKLLGPGQ